MLPTKLLNSYKKNGYVLIKNFFSNKDIEDIQNSLLTAAQKTFKIKISRKNYLNNKNFHSALINAKNKNPRLFGAFYDTLQNASVIYKTLSSDKILSYLGCLLKSKKENFVLSNIGIRMDLPKDTKHRYGWHQDRSYYHQNMDGNKGIVCWFPVMNIFDELGYLQVKKGSHKLGYFKVKMTKKNRNYSPQYLIPEKILKKFDTSAVKTKCKDLIIFSMNLFHASGVNKSKLIRFACQARYNDFTESKFVPHTLDLHYNNFMLNKKKRKI